MPENEDKIKKLYDTFVSDGYDMESEEDFRKNLSDSTKRKAAYDALVKEGYEMEPFEEFENNIGFGKIQTPAPEPAVQTEQAWQPTEQEKAEMIASTNRMMQNVETQIQDANERVDNIQEYGLNPGLQTKEGKMQFNPENGKLEKTYITPLGSKTTSKPLADIESFRYRQAADMSIGGQLRKANLRLQELKAKQAERASEVHKEWAEETEKNKAPLAAILGAATYTPRQQSDKENRALSVAIRETEEQIAALERQQERDSGNTQGFWRGMGDIFGDVRSYDIMGISALRDGLTELNADQLKGEHATYGEREAYDAMMEAKYENQLADQYRENDPWLYGVGQMAAQLPFFAAEIGLGNKLVGGLKVGSKLAGKATLKTFSKEAFDEITELGVKQYAKKYGVQDLFKQAGAWSVKALGTTVDDIAISATTINTVSGMGTAADAIARKLGDVVVDENGNYDFSNDKTWGDAVWQAEADKTIELWSERLGEHIPSLKQLDNLFGAGTISKLLGKADGTSLGNIYNTMSKYLGKVGVNGYLGEVGEEYAGQVARTILNLDDAYIQNPDGTRTNLFTSGKFHGDIWGGMAITMGLMQSMQGGLSGAVYVAQRHAVNKADTRASELLSADVWEPLRELIDMTPNEKVGEVADVLVSDKDFTDEERNAVMKYMFNSLQMRGFNLADLVHGKGKEPNEDEKLVKESYLNGYNTTSPQEMNDVKNMYEYQRERMKSELGVNDEVLEGDVVDWLSEAKNAMSTGTEQGRKRADVINDYVNAKQVRDGMMQRVRDDIDAQVEQSNSMIDARVNRKTGMIQGATMKQDDRKVYVISGALVPYADGNGVSITDSDNSIIVRDADTGELEQVSPDAILSIDDVQDPYEQKELAAQSIREQFAREAADKIDGIVTFNPGDAYTIAGEDGLQIQIQIAANEQGIVDNGDGTVNVSDGVKVFPITKETIQQQVDAANIARVAEFEQQRAVENAGIEQALQEADRPQYTLNDIICNSQDLF